MKSVLGALLFLLSASATNAADPAALVVPAPAVAVESKPAGPAPQYVPLTPELLKRWGYDAQKVVALPPDKRLELQRELTLLEIGRLRRIELLKRIKPDDWRNFLTDQELLTPEGMRLVDDYIKKMGNSPLLVPAQVKDFGRKDGKQLTAEDFARAQVIMDRMFDGVAAHSGGADMSGDWVVDARVRNETLYDITLTNQKTGVSLSAGQLFVDGRHPQAAPSWYGNLTWGADSKPDSWVDYRFKASLGYVDLHSRWFSTESSDPNVSRVFELGSQLGLPQDKLNQLSSYVTYDDPYKAHGIIVTSLLSELGRAYNLFGPVDVSWTVGGLVKSMWVAPNAAFDETLGLRVRLAGGLNLGIFGGVAQNVSPVGNHLLQDAITADTVKPGLYVEQAPHASLALWGKVPGVSDLQFAVSATQRRNHDTTVNEAEASLMTTFKNHPLAVRGIVSRESGPGIEFDRQKARLQLDYHLSDNASAFLAYERDRIKYGNAEVNSDAFLAGIQMQLGGSGSTVTMDHLFGGQYKDSSPLRPHFQQTLDSIHKELSAAVDVADKANKAYADIRPELTASQFESKLNQLSLSLSRLDPETAGHLLDELNKLGLSDYQKQALTNVWLRTVSQGSDYYAQLRSQMITSLGPNGNLGNELAWQQQRAIGDINRLVGGLSDAQRAQLGSFFDRVSQVVQQNPTLPPSVIQTLDSEGTKLISTFNDKTLTPLERQQMISLITGEAQKLGALVQKYGPAAAQDAARVVAKIDDWSGYFDKHKAEIRELIGLLTNEQVWDAAVIQAGRAQLIKAMAQYGKVAVPIMGKEFTLQIDAPAILASANILNSRLSPVAPLKAGEVDAFLLREAGSALGIDSKNPTDVQVANALFGLADAQMKQQLAQRLGPLLDKLGNYNTQTLANQILASVPPAAADLLKQRYGVDLSGLIVPNMSQAQVKDLLLNRLPDEVIKLLEAKYGPQLASGIAQAIGWAGDLLRREINMTMIQLMLASEELDRLTVDHGQKINDLDLRMAMRSFEMLDARGKQAALDRVSDIKALVIRDAGHDEEALAEKFTAHGKATLEALQLDPSWPAGLSVSVDDKAWMTLMTMYGDGRLFDLIERMKAKYAAKPRPGGLKISFEFDKTQPYGSSIWRDGKDHALRVVLGPAKDQRDAEFKLSHLEDYLDDK